MVIQHLRLLVGQPAKPRMIQGSFEHASPDCFDRNGGRDDAQAYRLSPMKCAILSGEPDAGGTINAHRPSHAGSNGKRPPQANGRKFHRESPLSGAIAARNR
jgi:hypothetical protein